jgi:hypothetical protein
MATTRRALAAGVALVAILVGVLVWKLREKPEPPREAPAVATTTSPSPTVFPSTGPAPTLGETGSAAVPAPQPKPLAPGEAPPALDAPVSKPAPPQKAFTREETIANREADLKLLDDTKTRLEGQLATAKANKDATATHDLEVRLARLVDLRKKREGELEKIRAGGPLPP